MDRFLLPARHAFGNYVALQHYKGHARLLKPLAVFFTATPATFGGRFERRCGCCQIACNSWGKQSLAIGTASVFVTLKPSPANAAFSISDLIEWYRALKEQRDVMR
ncbi:MAG: hypothetical protein ACREV4_03660 [Gammaproteobacteria bacterium]